MFVRRLVRLAAAAVLALAALAGPARADQTSFFVMPELPRGQRIIGGEVTIGTIGDAFRFADGASLLGLAGSVSWSVSDRLLINGYLPLVHVRSDLQDGSSLGNLTAGVTYRASTTATASSDRHLAVDASVSLPTASSSGDGGLAAFTWRTFYLPDRGRYFPDTTTIRVAGDYRVDSGRMAAQLELGLHQMVIEDLDDITLLRIGAGIGFMASSRVMLAGELTTVSDVLEDNDGEEFWHQLDLGLRVATSGGNVGVRLFLPLDESLRGRDIVGVTVQYQAEL